MTASPRIIDLREYESAHLDRAWMTDEEALLLHKRYQAQIKVSWPSPLTGYQWRLEPSGWVGFVPLSEALAFRLNPKIPLCNLFGMWEYAYGLRSFRFLEGLTSVSSLEAFYEQLANILIKQVLNRARQGFYRSYIQRWDELPYMRGRMDISRAMRRPWDVQLPCRFEEYTADIEDNQILSYTLWRIARSGVCTERVLPTVRRAYRSLQSLTTFRSFSPNECVGRRYHRLNQDYQPMHALSRFFLDQSGPTHQAGDRQIMPFLVHMPTLFELFVAEWLQVHLPEGWLVRRQEQVFFGNGRDQNFRIDLILSRIDTDWPYMVLDTKYKRDARPSEADVQQAVAYAAALHCTEAALIYPRRLERPRNFHVGGIRVRTLAFPLDGDLEEAGQRFLQQLSLETVRPTSSSPATL